MTEECFLMVFADMIARLIPTYDLLGWRNPYNLQYVRIFEQKFGLFLTSCHVRTQLFYQLSPKTRHNPFKIAMNERFIISRKNAKQEIQRSQRTCKSFFFFFFPTLTSYENLSELMLFISSELIINSTLSLFVDDQAFDGSSVGMKNMIASLQAFFFSCSFKLVSITLVQYSFSCKKSQLLQDIIVNKHAYTFFVFDIRLTQRGRIREKIGMK